MATRVKEDVGGFEHEVNDRAGVLAAPSVLDELRARREQLASEAPARLDLDVPGYNGRLVVRYRYPEDGHQRIVAAMQRAQESKDKDAGLTANCDCLVAACESVLARDTAGRLVELESDQPVAGDEIHDPIRFGKRLASLFGIPLPEGDKRVGRFVCRHIFSPKAAAQGIYDGDLALMAQGGRVLEWLGGVDGDVREEFVGE